MSKPVWSRMDFLQSIGLDKDVFQLPVAEQLFGYHDNDLAKKREIGLNSRNLSIPVAHEGRHLHDQLRDNRVAIVFGEPGAGKTTLRHATEIASRYSTYKTYSLVSSYTLNETYKTGSIDTHYCRIAESMTADLLIQVIENVDSLNPATPEHIEALAKIVCWFSRHLYRFIRRLVQDLEKLKVEEDVDLRENWRSIGRIPLFPVYATDKRIQLIENLAEKLNERALGSAQDNQPPTDSIKALQEVMAVARLWGFTDIYLLVDGIDVRKRKSAEMHKLLQPLLQQAEQHRHKDNLFLKFFIPTIPDATAWQEVILSELGDTCDPFVVELNWNDDALMRMLKARFRQAGSRQVSLDVFTSPDRRLFFDPPRTLDDIALLIANHHPRRFLQFINNLIDVHVARATDNAKHVTADEVEDALGNQTPEQAVQEQLFIMELGRL